MMDDPVTMDLADFGSRERAMAARLLDAMGERNDTQYLGDGVRVALNRSSGYVFLVDEDYGVAMLNGDRLADWLICSWCGMEGFADDFDDDEGHKLGEHGEILCRDEDERPFDDEDR